MYIYIYMRTSTSASARQARILTRARVTPVHYMCKTICSADGSTHTESNKLYRKVKHRYRPNLSPRQRPAAKSRHDQAALAASAEARGATHRARPRSPSRCQQVTRKQDTPTERPPPTPAQTTHKNTERTTARRRLIVEVVVAALKISVVHFAAEHRLALGLYV